MGVGKHSSSSRWAHEHHSRPSWPVLWWFISGRHRQKPWLEVAAVSSHPKWEGWTSGPIMLFSFSSSCPQENKPSVYFPNALVWERAKLSCRSQVAGKGRQRQIFAKFVNELLFHFSYWYLFRHNMRETCSDHSNVGDSTVILLVPDTGREEGRREEGRKSRKVKECQGVCRQFLRESQAFILA